MMRDMRSCKISRCAFKSAANLDGAAADVEGRARDNGVVGLCAQRRLGRPQRRQRRQFVARANGACNVDDCFNRTIIKSSPYLCDKIYSY